MFSYYCFSSDDFHHFCFISRFLTIEKIVQFMPEYFHEWNRLPLYRAIDSDEKIRKTFEFRIQFTSKESLREGNLEIWRSREIQISCRKKLIQDRGQNFFREWVGFWKSYVIVRVGHGKCLRPITWWVGGVKKGQKHAYVIFEWSLRYPKLRKKVFNWPEVHS